MSTEGKETNPRPGMNPAAGRPSLSATRAADPVQIRIRAMEFALETVRNVRNFTNYQVVHTADLYQKFILTGETPPAPNIPPPADVAEALSRLVDGKIQKWTDEPQVAGPETDDDPV